MYSEKKSSEDVASAVAGSAPATSTSIATSATPSTARTTAAAERVINHSPVVVVPCPPRLALTVALSSSDTYPDVRCERRRTERDFCNEVLNRKGERDLVTASGGYAAAARPRRCSHMSNAFRAGSRKARFLSLLVFGLVVAFGVLAGVAAADDDEAETDRTHAIVQVNLPSRAGIDELLERGVDLVEYVRENDDGTVTVDAVVSEDEQAELAAAGYQIGATIEDYDTYVARMAERSEALAAEERSHDAAESGAPAEATTNFRAFRFGTTAAAASELTVNRVDYFQNSAGWFLSVEVFDSAVNGTGSTGPTVSV